MRIVEVIPISRSFLKDDVLTYFTTKNAETGDLAEITLRKKPVLSVIISSVPLEEKKAHIRKKSFVLKKIERIVSEKFVNKTFLKTIGDLSDYFVTGRSSLLNFFLPATFLKESVLRSIPTPSAKKHIRHNPKISPLEAPRNERIKFYRALIRECMGRGESIAILLPTNSSSQNAYEELKTGLEKRVFILHSELTVSETIKNLREFLSSKDPAVLVGNASILAFLRSDTKTIVVEEESSDYYYNSLKRPFFDVRRAVRLLSETAGLSIVFGDISLRLDSGVETSALPGRRILSSAQNKVADARNTSKGEFKIFSNDVLSVLSSAREKSEPVVIIGHRRGFAPTTLCRDCGQTVACPNCSSPLVTHVESKDKKNFLCHHCLKKYEIPQRCPNCKSWNLASYGVGIEIIGDELKKLFPETKLFRFDRDSIKSKREAMRVKEDFLGSLTGFLVGTELFLNHFYSPLPHIVVASIDGLFSLPDYRTHEKIMNFLLRLRALAQKTFTIQTRLPEHHIFEYAVSGNIATFQKEETKERLKLNYPPSSDLVKITAENENLEKLTADISTVVKKLDTIAKANYEKKTPLSTLEHGPEIVDFPAFTTKARGKFRWNILIKFERGSWPREHIAIQKLIRELPPSWKIQVDPPSLL